MSVYALKSKIMERGSGIWGTINSWASLPARRLFPTIATLIGKALLDSVLHSECAGPVNLGLWDLVPSGEKAANSLVSRQIKPLL